VATTFQHQSRPTEAAINRYQCHFTKLEYFSKLEIVPSIMKPVQW